MDVPDQEHALQTDPPPRKSRVKIFFQWVGALCVLGVLALSAAVYWRIPLANTAIGFTLERAGIDNAVVRIDTLTFTRLRIAEIRLGEAADIRNIDAFLDLSHLPANPVRRLTVDRLIADTAGIRRELAKRPAEDTGNAPPPTLRVLLDQIADLPDIAIREFSLRHGTGDSTTTVTGSLDGVRGREAAYDLRIGIKVSGSLDGKAHTATIDGIAGVATDTATIEIATRTGEGGLVGAVNARADISADMAVFAGSAQLETRDIGGLAVFLSALDGAGGKVALKGATTAPLSFGLDTPLDSAALAAALKQAGTDGIRLESQIENGRFGDLYRGIDGAVTATLRSAADETGRLESNGTLTLRMRRAETAGVIAENTTLDGAFGLQRGDGEISLVFPKGIRATARVSVATPAVSAAPVRVSLNADRARVRATGDGTFRGADFGLRLEMSTNRLKLAGSAAPQNVTVSPLSLQLAGTVAADGSVKMTARAPRLAVTEKDRIGLMENLDVTIRRSPSNTTARIRGRVSAQDRGTPLLNPTPLDSTVKLNSDNLAFDAQAALPGGTAMTAKGSHNIAAGSGKAIISIPEFRMTLGGGELRALVPSLTGTAANIDFRSGTVHTETRLAWNKQGINATGAVTIENMTFADPASGTAVSGLTANIRLSEIVPPRTGPGQTIRIERVDAGAALTDLLFEFALVEGTAPAIPAVRIETFRTAFANGTLSLAPTIIDSEARRIQATLNVEGVDLGELLSTIGLENISGTGRLHGVIPVRTEGDAVGIAGGRLAAAAPGVLRIRSEAVKRVLAQGGEEVTLMLSALEDFRYDTLTLEIEKEIAGEGRVVLRTRGQNPAVRDGQPFVINLNLTGNVDNLAAVLAQALKLPGGIVRSMLSR